LPMVCNSSCPIGGQSLGPLVCGCVNHQCASYDSGAGGAGGSGGAGGAGGSGGAGGAGGTTTLPACTWPAALDAPDAGSGDCRAGRALLTCQGGNITELCISNDPSQCPGPDLTPGVSYTCTDFCAPREYAVVCGKIGVGFSGDPPTGCHNPQPTPGGTIFYCCPCL